MSGADDRPPAVRRYPIGIDIRDRRVVVVGGGAVAARKVDRLLACGARVHVVSPRVADRLAGFAEAGRITHHARAFAAGDLAGAVLAFAATDDAAVNHAVADEADRLGVLVDVADAPDRCTFTVPAEVRRGALLLTVSTDGACPALARRIRRDLDARFQTAWRDYVDVLRDVRRYLLRTRTAHESVDIPLEALLNGALLDALTRGDRAAADRAVRDAVGVGLDAVRDDVERTRS